MSFRMTTVAAGVAALAVIVVGRWWRAQESGHHDLQVDAKELVIVDVWLTDNLSHRLTMKNMSKHGLHIVSFDTSCNCTSITPGEFTLAPGESKAVAATINLGQIVRKNPTASQWRVAVSLQAHTAEPIVMPRWQLRGTVNCPLESIPRASTELVRLCRTDQAGRVSFDVCPKPGIEIDSASGITVGTSCRVLKAGTGKAQVDIEVEPAHMEVGPGLIRANLLMHDRHGNSLPPFPLEASSLITSSVAANPMVVLLSDNELPKTVDLRSTRGGRFQITNVKTCEGVQIELPAAAGEFMDRCVVRIQATAADASMSLRPLHIDVASENSSVRERLTLLVQLPTGALIESINAQ